MVEYSTLEENVLLIFKRCLAQSGSASALGAEGRGFKSPNTDHLTTNKDSAMMVESMTAGRVLVSPTAS